MSLQDFYKTTAVVKRLTAGFGGDQDKSDYQTIIAALACDIQQLDAEQAAFAGGVFGRTYALYCDRGVDIKMSDLITALGKEFRIKGIRDLDEGTIQHLEVIIEEDLS